MQVQDCKFCVPSMLLNVLRRQRARKGHCTVTYKYTLPSYPSASFCTYQTAHTLRSSCLKIAKRNFKSFGERSLCVISPSVWNSLPDRLYVPSDHLSVTRCLAICMCHLSICLEFPACQSSKFPHTDFKTHLKT